MNCVCHAAGWCERYQKTQSERHVAICRGTSGLGEEKEAAYRENWEKLAKGLFLGAGLSFITTRRLMDDTLWLLGKLPQDIAGIVGVARSGMLPATLLATQLHLPLWSFDPATTTLTPLGHGRRLGDAGLVEGRLLVVDDTVNSGKAMKHALEALAAHQPLAAAVYTTRCQRKILNYWAHDYEAPHLLEWNLFNSPLLPLLALDFDGILTRDGTTLPWYLPRKTEVELVVTGRSEALRSVSQAWLDKHRIRVKSLVMYPGPTPEELEVAAFKAKHFKESAQKIFVESSELQAAEIHRLTGRPVICPQAAAVFQSKPKPPEIVEAVGDELTKIIHWFGMRDDGCKTCESWRRKMNVWGAEGCRKNMSLILAHLREQAWKRSYLIGGLVATDLTLLPIVELAIANAVAAAQISKSHKEVRDGGILEPGGSAAQ